MRILVVDDHPVMRAMLRQTLELEAPITVVGEARDGAHALEQVPALLPDVVVMDVRMPGMGGPEATRRIVESWPHVRVLALSSSSELSAVAAMIDAGACGFVLKGESPAGLLRALQDAPAAAHPLRLEAAAPARTLRR